MLINSTPLNALDNGPSNGFRVPSSTAVYCTKGLLSGRPDKHTPQILAANKQPNYMHLTKVSRMASKYHRRPLYSTEDCLLKALGWAHAHTHTHTLQSVATMSKRHDSHMKYSFDASTDVEVTWDERPIHEMMILGRSTEYQTLPL